MLISPSRNNFRHSNSPSRNKSRHANSPSRKNSPPTFLTSPGRNAVQQPASGPASFVAPLRDVVVQSTRTVQTPQRFMTSHAVLQRAPSPTRAAPERLWSSPTRNRQHSPPQWNRFGLVSAAAVAGSRSSLRPQSPPPCHASFGSLEAPLQRKPLAMQQRSHLTHGSSEQYISKHAPKEQMVAQASQCSTSLASLPAPLSQSCSYLSESEASGVTAIPSSIETMPSSLMKVASMADESVPMIFPRLQEMSNDRESLIFNLGEAFSAVDRSNFGHLVRDDAVLVLHRTFAAQLKSLPSSCDADEAQWRSLLKTFGIYGPDDTIGFPMLLEVCMRRIASLRDRFAPYEALRAMQQVSRGALRLKDQYDSFEFHSKDSLGKVYVCRDSSTRHVRSCRQICKDKASLPMDEVRLSLARLMQVQHTGMPQVHGFIEDFHNFYIISALAPGIEIMDRIQDALQQNHILTESWVVGIIKQVLEVLAWCHGQSTGPVMHGELKPESVLLTADDYPRVSVTTMGLHVLFNSQPLDGMLPQSSSPISLPSIGMPEVLAPEVWRRDFGPRCDVWSCGCLMFLLVTGSLPFGPDLALPDLAHMIVGGEPDWRLFRHASTSALSLCRRMLSRDEVIRLSAHECLRHPWFGNCSGDHKNSRELRMETISSLLHFHTRAKLHQVLMNLIAAELKVSDLWRLSLVFGSYDTSCTGLLTSSQFKETLSVLGVMPESVAQVLHALIADRQEKVPYAVFLAGCADLVADKLDHMLWKIFSMVDEDCSGEVGTIELEHFLAATCGRESSERCANESGTSNGYGSNSSGDKEGSRLSRSAACDIERYLRGVLPLNLDTTDAVVRMARGRDVVSFEALKLFVLEGYGHAPSTPTPTAF